MAREKLKLVSFHTNESYIHLEPSEERRAIKIIKALPKYHQWTPISRLAKDIKESTLSTTSTAIRLWGAKQAEKDDNVGKPQILIRAPIILLRKEKYNHRNNQHKTKYLCSTIYFKAPSTLLKPWGHPINTKYL